ncbi:MAG TPA: transposase, partial [Acidimicrobiales bacterium]|nr:transposase [Acidimicrobiales bacterium]
TAPTPGPTSNVGSPPPYVAASPLSETWPARFAATSTRSSPLELGLSNARLEGINSRIRLIQRRGYGYRSVESLATMIYHCIGDITLQLPTQP